MKILAFQILFMAMLSAMPVFVSAQVFNGSLTLSTQAEVDAFNYTEVTGRLIIGYETGPTLSDINNLQPLSTLTKVGTFLIIRNNDQLQDLQGLENLASVESISIEDNDLLENIEDLNNISSTGSISIINLPKLTSLSGLQNVTALGVLVISNVDQLSDLLELANLTTLNTLHIHNIDQLQNLQGLENITNLHTLILEENASLTSLKHLGGMSSDASLIIINNNDQLEDLQGLENVSSASFIELNGNEQLQQITALGNLSSVTYLKFIENGQLQSLQGLEKLTSIGLGLIISNNDQLVDLQGLNNLAGIGLSINANNARRQAPQQLTNSSEMGNQSEEGVEQRRSTDLTEDDVFYGLSISNNDLLNNLQGLENLAVIDVDDDGQFLIVNNASLTSLQGLENLTSIRRAEFVWITSNPSLTSLQGLNNLTHIDENFSIRNNPVLVSLEGLDNLKGVLGYFNIGGNAQLKNLKGLESFTSAEGVVIENNTLLEDLEGLDNLSNVIDLYIVNNPSLNDCCAIADLVSKTDGSIRISDNGSNCNSVEAIQENCPPVITSFTLVDAVTDQNIQDLEDQSAPAVINILETGNQLNIRANTFPEEVGSVVFELDGVIVRKENVAPYALFGDEPTGDYHSGMFALGRHTLTATPYDGKNGKGQAGESLTLEFVVIDQALAVISFTLVTTHDNQDQYELKDGSTISLQQFDPAKLNIRANTFPAEVGSVVFDLNAVENFRTENVFPYALAGDDPPGDYKDYTLKSGTYWLTATPYSMPRGRGEAGMPLTITFEVVEDLMAVARIMSAPSPKAVEDVTVAQNITQVMIYPNPSEGLLHIKLPDTVQPVALYLYNAQGHRVMETTGSEAGSLILDVNHLAAGMYVLKVASDQRTEMHRILLK